MTDPPEFIPVHPTEESSIQYAKSFVSASITEMFRFVTELSVTLSMFILPVVGSPPFDQAGLVLYVHLIVAPPNRPDTPE